MEDGPTPQWPLGDYLRWWLEEVIRSRVRRRTHEHYAYLVRLHIAPQLGARVLAGGVSPLDVEAWMAGRRRAGLSGQSVFLARSCLRRAYNDAIRYRLVSENPAAEALPPQRERFKPMPLTPPEARTLLQAVSTDRLGALYSVALALGMRQGEIVGLRWTDVDLDRGVLKVEWQLQTVAGKPVFERAKGRKRQRSVHMPEAVTQALREHRIRQEQERLAAGDDWQDWGVVFAKPDGTPYRGDGIYQHFQRQLRKAGLRPRRFHDLRHSCASLLAAMDVPLEEIQEILGHADLAFTRNVYAHLYGAAGLQASTKMDEFMTGGSEASG